MTRNLYDGFDYSTIFPRVLGRLFTEYKKPPTYHFQDSWGSSCFLDPPGYPSHFLRSVYTQYGNTPPRGATQVFDYQGTLYVTQKNEDWQKVPKGEGWDYLHKRYQRRLHMLWNPLPIDHLRVYLWMKHVYGYFRNSYSLDGVNRNVSNTTGTGPDEWHLGYMMIKEFYPMAEPTISWQNDGGYGSNDLGIGDWIDMEAERPTPETCWPTNGRIPGNGGGWKHRNDGWCQYCGWRT